MLDFYLLSDQEPEPKPANVNHSNGSYLGSLSESAFECLKSNGIIEGRFDYYKGFRWNAGFVKQKLGFLSNRQDLKNEEIILLYRILQKAMKSGSGLISYSD